MIEEIPFTDTRVIGLRIRGKIDKEQYQKMEQLCVDRLRIHPKLRIYCELQEYKDMPIADFIQDVRASFPRINDFERKALVADESWIDQAIELGPHMFPSDRTKLFLPEQREEAMAWAIT